MIKSNKIIIGGDDITFNELSRYLSSEGYQVIPTKGNELDIQFEAMNCNAKSVFISSSTVNTDTLLKNLMKLDPKPLVFVVAPPDGDVNPSFMDNSHTTIIRTPIDMSIVGPLIVGQIEGEKIRVYEAAEYERYLHNYVSEILASLCITPNYNGFLYVREAIKMAVQEPLNSRSFSKTLYPKISKEFNSSASSIERNIRTVIIKGWEKASVSAKSNIFGTFATNSKWRPTNGEFILVIADKVHRELDDKMMKLS